MSCIDCEHFREYDEWDCVDNFQRRMSDGLCFDPNPTDDDNMPRFKADWCEHLIEK